MIDILIAHYKEPWEQFKRLLDSIALQDVDFSLVKVAVMNDGDEVVFDKALFKDYPFKIDYSIAQRSGTSKIRNLLLKKATAQYIWYLDPDDYLLEDGLRKVLDDLKSPLDLLVCGCQRQVRKDITKFFCPSFLSFSIVGCNILRRGFVIENKLYCDEKAYLAGDLVIEQLPKWYARNRRRLREAIFHYSYEPTSVTHNKSNGWRNEATDVVKRIIERLLKDGKNHQAYTEYTMYVFAYNSKYMHDAFVDTFKRLGLYKINYKLDLR